MHIGLAFGVCILLPGAGGFWLDGRINTSPAFFLVGLAFGFAAGMYYLLKELQGIEKKTVRGHNKGLKTGDTSMRKSGPENTNQLDTRIVSPPGPQDKEDK